MIRWIGRGLLGVLALAVGLGVAGWIFVAGLDLDALPQVNRDARADQLDFVQQRVPEARGRILAVLSSTARFADGKRAGYELTELSRAYWVFVANGFEVDLASPQGGEPPMVLDGDDVTDADFAFLNDENAQAKLAATIPLAQIDPARYAAVYFVGGKGTMFDFPGNPDVARIVYDIDARSGVVGAVCHGPAALVDLVRQDGKPWLHGRRVSAFTNAEELFLMEDARAHFPWLLQDKLSAQGAEFVEGQMYLRNHVVDGRLVTGQNPWSTWAVAEAMVEALGHVPVPRAVTGEELAVEVLAVYHRDGFDAARRARAATPGVDRRLLLMHAVVASMQWRLREAWQLQALGRDPA
jgi:putative intracellular protease/amidase